MRQEINLASPYAKALRIMPEQYSGQPLLPPRTECPFASVDELFADL